MIDLSITDIAESGLFDTLGIILKITQKTNKILARQLNFAETAGSFIFLKMTNKMLLQ